MRAIPAVLKTRLAERFKAESLGNEPILSLIATQTTLNTLQTETIHSDTTPAYGDVTIRQRSGDSAPSLAYAICVDNGYATVYSRALPSSEEHPWRQVWQLGVYGIRDAAIEYNGTWRMDVTKAWYYLETERYPYIFFIDSGDWLYVQTWQDETTRTLLAQNVSSVSVCRGWQSGDDPTIDQGLIAAYIRDGAVCYRALCCEEDGSMLWETERQVTELGDDNVFASVFRTNDFRVGFAAEDSAGEITIVLTGRSYAGQSVRPEAAIGMVRADSAKLVATPLNYLTAFTTETNACARVFDDGFYLGNFMNAQTCVPVSYERTSGTTFTVTFDHELWMRKALERYITVTRMSAAGNIVGTVTVRGNTMYVTTSEEMPGTEQITVAMLPYSNLLFYGTNTSPQPVDTFSILMDATVYYLADDESMTARLHSPVLAATPIEYPVTSQKEEGSVRYKAYNAVLTATQVGDVPI